MTEIDKMIETITKAIENGQTIRVYSIYYPVTIEIDGEAVFTANTRREVFYWFENYDIDTKKVIWI